MLLRANISSNLTPSPVSEGNNRAHSNKRRDSTPTLELLDLCYGTRIKNDTQTDTDNDVNARKTIGGKVQRNAHSSWMMKYSFRVSNVSISCRMFGWFTLEEAEEVTDCRTLRANVRSLSGD